MTHARKREGALLRVLPLLALTLASACSEEQGLGAPAAASAVDSSAPPTTAQVATSLAATTTSPSTTPTTTPPVTPHFEPQCVNRTNPDALATQADDPALANLTAVGAQPALEIQLPAAVTDSQPTGQSPIAGATRIPGGFLVTVGVDALGFGGIVAAVDIDGTVRWVRCTDDPVRTAHVAPLATQPEHFLLGTYRYEGQTETFLWEVVSLADGTTLMTLDDLVRGTAMTGDGGADNRSLVLADRGVAVFAPPYSQVVDVEVDGLLRVDLDTLAVSTTTFPPEFDGHQAGELELALGSDDSLLRMGTRLDNRLAIPLSVESDGTWVTDESARRAVWGPMVGLSWAEETGVASWDATGDVLWSVAVRFPGREGFIFDQSGDVAVVASCEPRDAAVPCTDEGLVGLDAETGRQLWTLPGIRLVGPMDDGVAYVTDSFTLDGTQQPSAWFLLDTDTGVVRETPSWPGSGTFSTGCCGDGDYHHTGHDGGVVIAVQGQTIQVWLPAVLTPPETVQVDLF